MSSEYGNPSSYTRGYGRGRARPDYGNRHYVHGGRGRGGGSSATSLSFPPEADIKKGLDTSNVIETIPAPPRPSSVEDVPIENVQYVASYNWVDTPQPTITVPGSPAVWTGREVPFTLMPDNESHFVDQNGARMSEYPLVPLFAAADAIHEDKKKAPVDWPAVDVITDRNGLRKLLRWLNPSEGREVRDFRIDVELIGAKTIVLNRWEGRTSEPPTGKSYGFGFEAATARAAPGCPISGHHRTITYDMLDMKMVVRFEVDACLSTETSTTTTTKTRTSDTKRSASPELAIDELADAFENMNFPTFPRVPTSPTRTTPSSPSLSSPTPSSLSPTLNIIRAGTQVPQESLIEVASRSKYFIDKLDWNELYPQLAISQTPGLRLGVHERGTFTEMREMQVDGDCDVGAGVPPALEAQKRETSAQFVRLARVLEDVQELAIARGPGPTGSFSLVCEGSELRAYARKGLRRSCLPPDVRARFARAGATVAADT